MRLWSVSLQHPNVEYFSNAVTLQSRAQLLPQKNSFEGINLLAFARMLDDERSPQDRCRLHSQACGGCVAGFAIARSGLYLDDFEVPDQREKGGSTFSICDVLRDGCALSDAELAGLLRNLVNTCAFLCVSVDWRQMEWSLSTRHH